MNNIAVLKIKGFFKLCWVRSVQIIRETVRVGKDLNLRFSMFAHTYIHNIGTLVCKLSKNPKQQHEIMGYMACSYIKY
jgi:hypothetical protein